MKYYIVFYTSGNTIPAYQGACYFQVASLPSIASICKTIRESYNIPVGISPTSILQITQEDYNNNQ